MDCNKAKEYLYPFIDNELTGDAVAEVEIHFASCPLCSLALEKEKKVDSLMRNYLVKENAPFELREKIINQLAQQKQKSFFNLVRFSPSLSAAALGGALVILFVIGTFFQRPSFPLFSKSVSNHIDYMKGGYPLEIKTNNIKEAVDWFTGKIDLAPMPPHIKLKDVELVGGRIIEFNNKKSAYYVFKKDGHTITAASVDLSDVTLPEFPKEKVMDKPGYMIVSSQERGYSSILCFHKKDGTACIFVSDLPIEELSKLLI